MPHAEITITLKLLRPGLYWIGLILFADWLGIKTPEWIMDKVAEHYILAIDPKTGKRII